MSMKRADKLNQFVKAAVTRTLEFEFERMPYRLEEVSSKKLLTLLRSELDYLREKTPSPWYPWQLQVEPSAACSLKCPLCPSGTDTSASAQRFMPFPMFRDLIDEVGDHVVICVFWMWGEPMLNRKLPDMIAYARSKNIGTVTSTNGQHIQTVEEAETLVRSGLDNLVVAIDGATQETYGKYRVGGDLQKIFRCLEMLKQAKESLGSTTPKVNVRTVVTKNNEHELPEIERIASQYGADWVSRKTASALDHSDLELRDDYVPSNTHYRRFIYKDGKRVRMPASHFRCRRAWKRITLASDGTVLPCEFDCEKTTPFGKYGEGSSFMQIWKGEQAEAFRRQFLTDRMVNKFCAYCPSRDRIQRECTIEIESLKS